MQSHFQKRLIFFAGGFLVLTITAFFFLYRQIQNNTDKYQTSYKEWQKEAARREELRSLDSSVKKIETEKIALESHFAESSNVVPFLDMIEGLGIQAGATASVASVDVAGDGSGLLVQIKAEGNFSTIYTFLTLMENSPYIISFGTVELHREGAVDAKGKSEVVPWSADVRIKLLSFTK